MCDTSVVLATASKNGEAFFAKNSDRSPNEAQYLTIFPAKDHNKSALVRCTYVEIPQARHTFSVLLSKPYWMWGAEMGANECGVVIGNEAIFSKVPAGKAPGLIGMDYLRLALERSATALEALRTITDLLQNYGQSGNCSAEHELYYHNSYLIMDGKEAYVLETIDRMWIAKKVKDFYAISNGLSITTEWDFISDGLIDYAVEKKWCRDKKRFNFKESFSDTIYSKFSQGGERRTCVMKTLEKNRGNIDLQLMKTVLRSHDLNPQKSFPDRSFVAWNVCMHAGPGPIRDSQTTGSLITQYSKNAHTFWVTGTAAPCISVFKPVWISSGLPDIGPEPNGVYDTNCLWWQHEVLHRHVLKDYHTRHAFLKPQIEKVEEDIDKLIADGTQGKTRITEKAFQLEKTRLPEWILQVDTISGGHKNARYYERYWRKKNKKVNIPV